MSAPAPEATILVVDDESSMLRSVSRVLSSRWAVSATTSPGEALRMAAELRPDLAILDIRMPEMNGYELCGLLHQELPELAVIFMTGAVHELDAQLLREIRQKAFHFIQKPFDREVLLTLVEGCVEVQRLQREKRAYLAHLQEEMEEARRFQRSLLPDASAELGRVSLAAHYEPCDELGGDLYDFAPVEGGGVAFLVADVSGHGVPAAMWTGAIKSAFRGAHADGFEPAAVARRITDAVRFFDDARMVSLLAGRVDDGGRALEYVNAGHPAGLLWREGERPRLLERTGMVVTPAFPELEPEQARVELGSGDRLLLYTDGLIEARSGEEFFGEERVADCVRRGPADCAALIDHVLDTLSSFLSGAPRDDDLTLLTLRVD